ncbi:MAG: histidine kinase dimerization/phospho-acceptor domain-containing protein, partial [Candidatus Sericytochromatia bacterium]
MNPGDQSWSAAPGADPLLDAAARCLALTCDMGACRLYLASPDGRLVPVGFSAPRLDPAEHPWLSQALAGRTVGGDMASPAPERGLLLALDAPALLALPLHADGAAMGVALLTDRRLPDLSEARLAVAAAQAGAIAAALPEALAAMARREQELAALCALTTVPHEAPVELLTRVLASILELTRLDSGLLLYHGHGLAATGAAIALAPTLLETLNDFEARHGMEALYAVLAGADFHDCPDREALLSACRAALAPWVVLPLKSGRQIAGVLVLGGTEYHQLSDNMSRLLATVIQHLLLSMELYRALDSMEALVTERTAALVESNRQLEATVVELKRVDQFKTDFLSNVSHELRTPLCGIIGYG